MISIAELPANEREPLQPSKKKPSFNIGLTFIVGFRWMLLLLFTLLLEKAAEGITARLTPNSVTYSSVVVNTFMFGSPEQPVDFPLQPNLTYLSGVLQLLVTALFAVRYFLCLIDPLERIAQINHESEESLSAESMKTKLKEVGWSHVALVSCIALPEFVLLFHASTALPSFEQWAKFLFWLVAIDSTFFFVVYPLRYKAIECWQVVVGKYYDLLIGFSARYTRIVDGFRLHMRLERKMKGEAISMDDAVSAAENRFQSVLVRYGSRKSDWLVRNKARMDAVMGATAEYGPWNFLDVLVLVLALLDAYFCKRNAWTAVPEYASLGVLFVSLFFLALIAVKRLGDSKYRIVRRKLVLLLSSFVPLLGLQFFQDTGMASGGLHDFHDFLRQLWLLGAFVSLTVLNYRVQPELWNRHIEILKLQDNGVAT